MTPPNGDPGQPPKREPFDPTKPDIKLATGTGKKMGGWLHWVIGLTALALILAAAAYCSRTDQEPTPTVSYHS